MKKLLPIVLALFCSMGIFAQAAYEVRTNLHPAGSTAGASYKTEATAADTSLLTQFNIGTATYSYYQLSAPNWGYLHGTNSIHLQGFAEKYDISGHDSNVTVLGVAYFMGGTVFHPSSRYVDFKVYSNTGGYPGSVGASGRVYDTSLVLADTVLHIGYKAVAPATANYADSFFVSMELPADTIVTDSLYLFVVGSRPAADTIRHRNCISPGGGIWVDDYKNTGLKTYYALFPLVIINRTPHVGIQESGVAKNGMTVHGVFPNPATDNFNLELGLAESRTMEMTLYNSAGALIKSYNTEHLAAGEHTLHLNANDVPAGTYILVVQSESGVMGVQVVKQ